jgi:hypothetical protein
VVAPTPPARPLSMQVDAINSKEYFRRSSVAMKSPAEIGEMKRDLDFCLKELQHASKRIEELEYRNGVLESEVSFLRTRALSCVVSCSSKATGLGYVRLWLPFC